MLHVHGGSIVLEKLRAAGLPGRFLEWCDVLCQGPMPAAVSRDEWREVRASFLDREYGPQDGRPAGRRLEEQDAALEAARDADDIVLWFSADWFCQTILACLLARLGASGRVSVVCVGSWPGVDDGRSCTLAHMPDAALREAFERRVPVDVDLVRDAHRVWDALRSPDPRTVARLAAEPLAALPFAREGLRRHLAELPAPRSGLNRTERSVLEAVDAKPRKAIDLFPIVADRESRKWITDTVFAAALRRLAAAPAPLVRLTPADDLRGALSPERLRVAVEPTRLARPVLAREKDWMAHADVDRWVGGVHLTPDNLWRWDEETEKLTAP